MFGFKIVRNKCACMLLLTTLLLATFSNLVIVKSSPTTTVEAGSISLYPNDVGNVPITVRNIPSSESLGSYDLIITYNSSVIQIQDALGGSAPFNSKPTFNPNYAANKVRFNAFTIQMSGVTGTITITYLKIKAIGNAGSSSSLIITILNLYDPNGTEIEPRSPVSGSVTILTPKPSSSITVSVDKNVTSFGENITVSGAISPAVSTSVGLTFTRPNSSKVSKTVNSGTNGAYMFVFTPDMAGTWTVEASWAGDARHQGATSPQWTFVVESLGSSISVFLSPNAIKPNGSIQISGQLNPAYVEAEVTLTYRLQGGVWKNVTKTRTNATGGYLYLWLTRLTAPGTYELKASWPGDGKYGAAENSALFAVAGNSTLSISLSTNSTGVNGVVVIGGKVSPVHAFAEIFLSCRAPNGTLMSWTVQTDTAGNYRTLFIPDITGKWSFWSKWLGDFDTLGSESVPVELTVFLTGSSIELQASIALLTIGNTITFSGRIMPAAGSSLVTLSLVRQNNSIVLLETTSNVDGSFSQTFTPDQAGIWLVQASWTGDSNHGGATSPQISFIVEKLQSAITLFPTPPIPRKGDLVRLEGAISPAVYGVSVKVFKSTDEGTTWTEIAAPNTGINGEYSLSWRPEELGTVCIKTEWSGDENRSACVSNILYLTIQEDVLHQTVSLPNAQTAEVGLSTNSSTGSLTVDAANGRIEVNVTGPTATKGIMNIFVPDSLLESYNKSISDVVFTVDSSPVTPSALRVSNGYLVTIFYSHSTRTIAVHYITYSLQLNVKDFRNEPLIQAVVLLSGPIKTSSITGASGIAYFPHVPTGQYTIEVFFGSKVAEVSVDVTTNEILIINSEAGKTEAEYSELQELYNQLRTENQTLTTELNILQISLYVSIAVIVALAALLLYIIRKARAH